MNQDPESVRRRNRSMLVVIFVLFFGGMLVAGALRFSGWRPQGTKSRGELLQPYGDLRRYTARLSGGRAYRWTDSPRTWRIVVAPRECDGAGRAACMQLLRQLDTVWRLMGKDADRVHVLWIGAWPAAVPMLREVRVLRADAVLPQQLARSNVPSGTPAWLVDPNGFVVLRYAPGFDPGDLRADLARLLNVN